LVELSAMTPIQTTAFAAAAERGMRACQDACRELQRMMATINADRVTRGAAPLAIEIAVPGEDP
jgi:hypothetical protein